MRRIWSLFVGGSMSNVSVVISTWNNKDNLLDCLKSVKSQTLKPSEIIVVDNHSSDGTTKLLAEKFPAIRCIITPDSTYGACETLNIGMSSAKNDFIVVLDDDVTLPRNWMQNMLAKIKTEPRSTAIIFGKVIEPKMPAELTESSGYNKEAYTCTFRGCGFLVKKSALEKVGYYDKKLFIYGNERDLAARLLLAGYRVKYNPAAITYHKKPYGIKMSTRSLYFHLRNYAWYIFTYYPLFDILKSFIFILTSPLPKKKRNTYIEVGSVFSSIFQTPANFLVSLKALFDALVGMPYWIKKRHPIRHPDFKPFFRE